MSASGSLINVNYVLIANPGKIPDRTPEDFGCREDFDRKEFCFPSQIPATLPPRYPVTRQESRQDSRRDPAEILAAENPVSHQDSRQDSRWNPAEFALQELKIFFN